MPRFYHGTITAFARHAKEAGLIPPKGHGRGVRLSRLAVEAREHARAYAAGIPATKILMAGASGFPEGAVLVIEIEDLSRLRVDSNDVIRASFVLQPEIVQVLGPIKFPELGSLEVGAPERVGEAFWDAVECFERLTDQRVNLPFRRPLARRS